MKGILGLVLALIAPLPPVVASSVQPHRNDHYRPRRIHYGEF